MVVYEGTLQAIEAAERATLKTAARYLEEHMGPAIASITDGRYDEIEVDETSLAFRVRAPETGELVDVASALAGNRRPALPGRPAGPGPPGDHGPAPAAHPGRPLRDVRCRARRARPARWSSRSPPRRASRSSCLTCSDRYDRFADELIVLPGPSNERVLAVPRQAGGEPAATPPPAPAAAGSLPAPGSASVPPVAARPTAAPAPAPTQAAPRPRSPEAPQPTLHFEPDPRPNPDPVAPRRPIAIEDDEPDPLDALRRAASLASEDEESEGPG